MKEKLTIELATPAHDMAQEEILKQVAFVSKDASGATFSADGARLELWAPPAQAKELRPKVQALAQRVQRGLRSLERKIVYRSPAMEQPAFCGSGTTAGVHQLGPGQVALEGVALGLFKYFDRVFEAMGEPWQATPLMTPTLIPATVLAKCDYFRSFPHNVTFACHLHEDAGVIEDFRTRHQQRDSLDDQALTSMDTPEACLSPAVCYHVYHVNQNRTVPETGMSYGVCGKCFRYESSNMRGLRRLWDFTMREIVFLGDRDDVLRRRERGIELMSRFLHVHRLAGEIRTASDPFFIAPDAVAKTYFQLSSETKYEVSLLLPENARVAVGSLNYHTDFFGRAFNTSVAAGGFMHSVCIAFGLERWVHAFLAQHGDQPSQWPEIMRRAPEFQA